MCLGVPGEKWLDQRRPDARVLAVPSDPCETLGPLRDFSRGLATAPGISRARRRAQIWTLFTPLSRQDLQDIVSTF
jgi:hypothetical protein